MLHLVQTINAYLSDYILIILLVGTGLFFTFKTRFVQVRCFKEGWKAVFGNVKLLGDRQSSGLSSFQALATAVAAQVGTGNIVGTILHLRVFVKQKFGGSSLNLAAYP